MATSLTEPSPLPPSPDPSRVFARRSARIAFGVVLLLGAIALVATLLLRPCCRPPPTPRAEQTIGYTWLAAAAAAAVAYVLARARRLRSRPDALFLPSLVVPVAGAALLLPLTEYLLLALTVGATSDFSTDVSDIMVLTGVAQLAFATLSVQRVRQLAAGRPALNPFEILGLTMAVSCLYLLVLCFAYRSGYLLFVMMLPPTIVAITGLPILPLLYWMERVVARERAEIAALPRPLPRAIAAAPRRVA